MKKRIITACLCLLYLFCGNQIFAQRSGMYIGKLDLYTAVMLHPSMVWYSPEKKAFKVSRDSISKQRIVREKESNSEERKRLESKMKTLKSRIKEEEQKYNNTIANLSRRYVDSLDKVGTATAELNKINFKKYSEEALVIYQTKINSYYGEYTLCEDKLSKIENITDDSFTSSEETEKRFIEIINEIKAYAKRIADQKGISIVLNSGYKRLLPANNGRSQSIAPDSNTFGSIFSTGFPSELLRDEASIRGYYLGIESNIINWLELGKDALGYSGRLLVEEDILIGGVDLTPEVLNSIYKAYKIDANIANAIIKSLKK